MTLQGNRERIALRLFPVLISGRLQEDVEPWTAGLWDSLERVIAGSSESSSATVSKENKLNISVPRLRPKHVSIKFLTSKDIEIDREDNYSHIPVDRHRIFLASLKDAQWLTAEGCIHPKVSITLDISASQGNEKQFLPGDSLAVICPNREETWKTVLQHFELSGDEIFVLEAAASATSQSVDIPKCFRSPCTARVAFSECIDLSSTPSKPMIRMLADYCHDQSEKFQLLNLCSKKGNCY